MTFRLFSHAAKPSSASGVVAETSSAMGDGEEAEGLKKRVDLCLHSLQDRNCS